MCQVVAGNFSSRSCPGVSYDNSQAGSTNETKARKNHQYEAICITSTLVVVDPDCYGVEQYIESKRKGQEGAASD